MKRYFITKMSLAICTLMTVCLSSCSNNSVYGTYGNTQNPNDTMELKPDKTFFVTQHSMSMHGTFEVDGTNITLELPTGQAARGTIQGDTVIDDEGIRWTKKQ